MKHKAVLLKVVVWAVWFGICWAAFSNVIQVQQVYPTFSLRYSQPVESDKAQAARVFAAEKEKQAKATDSTGNFWPVYWSQTKGELVSELGKADADLLMYSGAGEQVWPTRFMSGSYPGVSQANGCAISDKLAWKLWGSTDVVGREAMLGDTKITVTGVFTDSRMRAIVNVGEKDYKPGWQAVELQTGEKATRKQAEEFAMSAGLGKPDTIVDGGTISFIAQAAAALPIIVLMLAGLAMVFKLGKDRLRGSRQWIVLLLLLGLVIMLPSLLEKLPQRWIPNQWSDLSFWSELWKEMKGYFEEFLMLQPLGKDLLGKERLFVQAGLFFLGGWLAWPLFSMSFGKKTMEETAEQPTLELISEAGEVETPAEVKLLSEWVSEKNTANEPENGIEQN